MPLNSHSFLILFFTADLVMKAIRSCRNSKAFGPDKLSIFHLKHLGPRVIEYITTLFKTHPSMLIEDSRLPLGIFVIYLDPLLSFNKHSQYVAGRVSGRNNLFKALSGTSWGQQKEILLITYKAVRRSIIN